MQANLIGSMALLALLSSLTACERSQDHTSPATTKQEDRQQADPASPGGNTPSQKAENPTGTGGSGDHLGR
jgi:hypothetical protein